MSGEETELFTGPHTIQLSAWISCAPFERLLSMEIVEAVDGRSVLRMPFLAEYANGNGLMHGGALVSLADTAVAMAIKSIVAPQSHFVTVAMNTKFLLPVIKGMVTARASVNPKEGRLLEGEAAVYDENGRTVMAFHCTFKVSRDATVAEHVIHTG